MAAERKLTQAQVRALRWLTDSIGDEGAVGCEASALIDGQPWIHWRTVSSLEALALVETEWFGGDDGAAVRLTPAGRAALTEHGSEG